MFFWNCIQLVLFIDTENKLPALLSKFVLQAVACPLKFLNVKNKIISYIYTKP